MLGIPHNPRIINLAVVEVVGLGPLRMPGGEALRVHMVSPASRIIIVIITGRVSKKWLSRKRII